MIGFFSINVVEKLFSYLISVQLEHTPAENTSFAQLFLPYVCPEPVLAK